jgi:hypothetical protein
VHGATGGVDTDVAHRRQVDHQAVLDDGRAHNLVDHAVPDLARGLVLELIGRDHRAGHALGERGGKIGAGGRMDGHDRVPWRGVCSLRGGG